MRRPRNDVNLKLPRAVVYDGSGSAASSGILQTVPPLDVDFPLEWLLSADAATNVNELSW